ncbi:MAG: hypothetical protein DSY89_04270 [Deltaproteobacteria bacterium]|nr:MAG: hypothetical protein DSY89_04270 [Deltaproteobacteria bacterium]
MEINCPACQAGFRIPDEKLPKDRDAIAFSCPKCAHPITVDLQEKADTPPPLSEPPGIVIEDDTPVEPESSAESSADLSYDAADKPFDFVEEGQLTALICESDPGMARKINEALENLGFRCAQAESTLAAIKYMRYHVFDMVALNDAFDGQSPETNPIRMFISRLPMSTRRNMFVTLLTDRFRTMDNMAAYNLSVNQVIDTKNIDEIEQIIRRGLDDNNVFYSTYKKVLAAFLATDAV